MPPVGSEQALTEAAAHGWEAALVVVIVIGMITALTFVYKAATAREERLAARVTTLEQSLENNLTTLVKDTTVALTRNSDTLNKTNEMLDKLQECVMASHKDTARLIARVDSSVCCLSSLGMLSNETQERIDNMKRVVEEAGVSNS